MRSAVKAAAGGRVFNFVEICGWVWVTLGLWAGRRFFADLSTNRAQEPKSEALGDCVRKRYPCPGGGMGGAQSPQPQQKNERV